jgi:hypothetical protein
MFEAAGIRLKAGRVFTSRDRASGERVVIVNQMLAKKRRDWTSDDTGWSYRGAFFWACLPKSLASLLFGVTAGAGSHDAGFACVSVVRQRFSTMMLGVFALFASVLAAVGVYGAMVLLPR